jgi:FkbM family methyltransferase
MRGRKGIISIRGHTIDANLLDETSIVIDLGAHLGEFSSELSDRFGCSCYLVEASPFLYSQIQESRLKKKFNLAATDHDGPITFHISDNPESSSISRRPGTVPQQTVTVDGCTLETFMRSNQLTSVDLLKVDIEGAEIELFQSLSDNTLKRIKQITIEFHDFIKEIRCAEAVEGIANRLTSLGFVCVVFSWSNKSDTLFLNKKISGVSTLRYLFVKYVTKYVMGLRRATSRFSSCAAGVRCV